MKLDELKQKLKEIQKSHADPENKHLDADYLLLEYIADSDVIRLFKKIDRWYSEPLQEPDYDRIF